MTAEGKGGHKCIDVGPETEDIRTLDHALKHLEQSRNYASIRRGKISQAETRPNSSSPSVLH